MRQWLFLLLLVPMVQGISFTDEAGDQLLGYSTHYENGEPQYQWYQADEQQWYQNVDIQSVEITETETHLVFTMKVGSYEAEGPEADPVIPRFEEFVHVISFTLGGQEHHVGFVEDRFFDQGLILAVLHHFESSFFGDRYFPSYFQSNPAIELTDGVGWTAELPKSYFRTTDLVPLREGHVLEDIHIGSKDNEFRFSATATICPSANTQPPGPPSTFGGFCRWTIRDDNPESVGDFEVELTPPGVGHLFMRIPAPYRLSNGLATTYLFEADLHNLEPLQDQVRLQVDGIPDGWEVRLPTSITFTGEDKVVVPIAVTVPFSHVHGKNHFMGLTAVSDRDPSVSIESGFGVIFADPPQPGGHHDTMWFHAEDPCGAQFNDGQGCPRLYMNADKDPAETLYYDSRFVDEADGNRQFYDFLDPDEAGLPAQLQWNVELQPGLGIGLDFDTSKKAKAEVGIRMGGDWTADVTGTLFLVEWGFLEEPVWTQLASGTTSSVNFPADQGQIVEVELDVASDADLIHYEPGRSLVFQVNVTDTSGLPWSARQDDGWIVTDDSWLQLPLIDYHEDVDLSGLSFNKIQIERLNGTMKLVNPGNTTVFGFEVTNTGEAKATLDWEIIGSDPFTSWASIKPLVTHMDAGKNGTVVVSVKAPLTAVEGDTAELLLIGTSREDPNTQVFGRLTAYVVEGRSIADESDAARELEKEAEMRNEASKESPLPLAFVLAALLIALRRR